MPLVFCTGYEHGVSPINSNGSGLSSGIGGNPVLVTSPVHSGTYALKIATDGVTAQYVRHRFDVAGTVYTIGVARFYLYMTAYQNNNDYATAGFQVTTASSMVGLDMSNAGVISAVISGGSRVNGPTLALNRWHYIEFRLNVSGTTWTIDWMVNGVTQTQATAGGKSADTLSYLRFGASSSTYNSGVFHYDDLAMSVTSADYPLGNGYTVALVPSADGTHNAGTNVMERQDGSDINGTTVTAYDLINGIPMTENTTYVLANNAGATNYAEVLFGDIVVPFGRILGATALLAYTSATTSTNNGATIISDDNWSTSFALWGSAASPADMSDGSLSNLYYKFIILTSTLTKDKVNALKARIGYSSDATPDPYWVNILVEVAYSILPSGKLDVNQAVNRAAVI